MVSTVSQRFSWSQVGRFRRGCYLVCYPILECCFFLSSHYIVALLDPASFEKELGRLAGCWEEEASVLARAVAAKA